MAVVGVNVLGDHPQRHPLDLAIRRAMARSAEELCPRTQPSYTSPPFLNSTFTNKSRATRRGRTRWCPVSALDAWFELSGIHDAAVFRSVNSHGVIGTGRLSAEAVSLIIKQRVAATGLDPAAYSGHSLRAGFVTSAAQAGVPTWKIRQQTGHASDTMLQRYIREGELFVKNAAGALL